MIQYRVESLRDKAIKICKAHLMIQYRLNPSEKGYKNMSRLGVPQDAEHQEQGTLLPSTPRHTTNNRKNIYNTGPVVKLVTQDQVATKQGLQALI
nr:Biomphalaria glabrata replication factor C subunit 4-like; transcript variant X6 [Biomphalaria glabrata]